MKKDRNAFFQNNSSASYFYPMNNMVPYMTGTPMGTESNSSFYSGPIMPIQNMNMSNEYNSELETRLAKIERQLNRLDTRISKLESEITNFSGNNEYTTNNMYMV